MDISRRHGGFQGLVCSGADLLGGLGKRLGINEDIYSEFLQRCYLDCKPWIYQRNLRCQSCFLPTVWWIFGKSYIVVFFGNIMIRKISIRSLRLGDFSLFSVGLLWLKRLERLVAAKSATWRYKGAIPKGYRLHPWWEGSCWNEPMKARTRTSLKEDLVDLYDDLAIGWNELFEERMSGCVVTSF